jgi:precorrin-6A/cobalt-precorrin-6A reductase
VKVLVLGGTAEARALAERIPNAVYSLAGRTAHPRLPTCEVRSGPFGGADGLLRYLRDSRIEAVIDATHPFADQMPLHAAEACDAAGIPRLKLVRAPWTPGPGDQWQNVADTEAAAAALEPGSRVFLAIGIQELGVFAAHEDILFLVRTVDEPAEPLPFAAYRHIAGRGPFPLDSEKDLLARYFIETLVCKNSGGDRAKLDAARALGIKVIMIDRPPQPAGLTAGSVEDALAWLNGVTR